MKKLRTEKIERNARKLSKVFEICNKREKMLKCNEKIFNWKKCAKIPLQVFHHLTKFKYVNMWHNR